MSNFQVKLLFCLHLTYCVLLDILGLLYYNFHAGTLWIRKCVMDLHALINAKCSQSKLCLSSLDPHEEQKINKTLSFPFFPWKIIIPKCFCMWRPCRLTHTQNYINNSSHINNPTHTVTISFKIHTYRFLSYICFVSWSAALTLTAWLSVEVVIQ